MIFKKGLGCGCTYTISYPEFANVRIHQNQINCTDLRGNNLASCQTIDDVGLDIDIGYACVAEYDLGCESYIGPNRDKWLVQEFEHYSCSGQSGGHQTDMHGVNDWYQACGTDPVTLCKECDCDTLAPADPGPEGCYKFSLLDFGAPESGITTAQKYTGSGTVCHDYLTCQRDLWESEVNAEDKRAKSFADCNKPKQMGVSTLVSTMITGVDTAVAAGYAVNQTYTADSFTLTLATPIPNWNGEPWARLLLRGNITEQRDIDDYPTLSNLMNVCRCNFPPTDIELNECMKNDADTDPLEIAPWCRLSLELAEHGVIATNPAPFFISGNAEYLAGKVNGSWGSLGVTATGNNFWLGVRYPDTLVPCDTCGLAAGCQYKYGNNECNNFTISQTGCGETFYSPLYSDEWELVTVTASSMTWKARPRYWFFGYVEIEKHYFRIQHRQVSRIFCSSNLVTELWFFESNVSTIYGCESCVYTDSQECEEFGFTCCGEEQNCNVFVEYSDELSIVHDGRIPNIGFPGFRAFAYWYSSNVIPMMHDNCLPMNEWIFLEADAYSESSEACAPFNPLQAGYFTPTIAVSV